MKPNFYTKVKLQAVLFVPFLIFFITLIISVLSFPQKASAIALCEEVGNPVVSIGVSGTVVPPGTTVNFSVSGEGEPSSPWGADWPGGSRQFPGPNSFSGTTDPITGPTGIYAWILQNCVGDQPFADAFVALDVISCSPVNATLSDWGGCSVSCGGGTQTRTCSGANECGDTSCGGAALIQSCNTQSCCAAGFGNSCTSSANSCGQTNSGTIQCDGSCSAGTPGNPPGFGNSCTSSANACGQTNSGSIQCNGSCSASPPDNPPGYGNGCTSSVNSCGQTNSGTIQCNGSCSASTPPLSSCPATTVSISANPTSVAYGGSSTISWSSSNANSCTASGDWSGAKSLSGNQSTGALNIVKTYNYTLTCSGYNGSPAQSASVVVNAPTPVTSNVAVTEPNYCSSGPAATVSWTYSDPSGSPQQSYQVQVDDQNSFNSPEVDSGKINSSSNSYFTGQGLLQFNTAYKARVRAWNGYDRVSGWTTSSSFKTPNFAYPQVNFTWSSNGISENPSPPIGKDVQFTDQTVFQGNPIQHDWSWNFGDSTSSTQQNPLKVYNAEGTYYVTLTATDSQNQTCARTRGPFIIQKPIPRWREVAPR